MAAFISDPPHDPTYMFYLLFSAILETADLVEMSRDDLRNMVIDAIDNMTKHKEADECQTH